MRAFPNHRIYRSSYTHLCAAAGRVISLVFGRPSVVERLAAFFARAASP